MGKKNKLGILGASLLAGSLAFGSEAYAQQTQVQKNKIYSRNPEYSASGEGVLLKDFVYDLPDSTVNIGKWLGLYAQRGDISYDAVNTRKGLENTLSYLREGTQTPEKRASIDYVQRLLRTMSETDSTSLKALREAVADGSINSQEITEIKPNTYIIIAKSSAGQGYVSESVPILVNIRAKPISSVPPARREPEPVRGRVDTLRTDTIPRVTQRPLYTPRESERHERKKSSARLTLDGFAGENKVIGAGIGIGYGPVGFSVNYSQAGDRTVDSVTVPLSVGRIGTGIKEERDFRSLGITVELHPLESLFLGAGVNSGNYTTRVKESIISASGDTLETNTNSRSDNKHSYRIFGGAEIPLNSMLGLRVFGGYDSRKGAWGGLGGRFRLNKK